MISILKEAENLFKITNKKKAEEISNLIYKASYKKFDYSSLNDVKVAAANKEFSEVAISKRQKINLLNHPLGVAVLKFIEKAFIVADEATVAEVSLKEINDIVNLAILYDQSLNKHTSLDQNPNPLTAFEFDYLVDGALKYQATNYRKIGKLDVETIRELAGILKKKYLDVYLEDYMKLPMSEEDYLTEEYYKAVSKAKNSPPGFAVKTPEEVKKLNKENDEDMSDMQMSQRSRDLERKHYPERYDKEQSRERERLKKEYPERWHDVLFDKK